MYTLVVMRGVALLLVMMPSWEFASGEPAPENRLAIDGWIGGGLLAGVALSFHYERGSVGSATGGVRAEAAGAINVADGRHGDRGTLSVMGGGRYYFGPRGYVAAELGVSVIRYPGHDDLISSSPARTSLGVAGRAGIGAHLGRVDLGIAVNAAALGVGVYLGRDFGVW